MILTHNCCIRVVFVDKRPFLVLALLVLGGCTPPPMEFRPNELHVASLVQDAQDPRITGFAFNARKLTTELFGTPDSPAWPMGVPVSVDMEKVARASGPVGRNEAKVERGLFRKHCVQCHGTAGDGLGPASALLAPYPRDFRRGSFKFKSTPIGKKPTHADLVRTIECGLPGTSMPAFGTLNLSKEFEHDIDALAHYVRFLSIRGEVERRLIASIVHEELASETPTQVATKVADSWLVADSVERGKLVFLSELTACSKCHGKEGDGNGTSKDFDEWTKDWTIRAGIDPTKKAEWKPMKKYGALKPVVDSARNLKLGALRGGATRSELYRRIVLGIEGSPMPAIARKEGTNPGVTEEGIQDLVEYICSLSGIAPTERETDAQPSIEVNHAQSN
jgi:mono/diheme cytochrome c family protein